MMQEKAEAYAALHFRNKDKVTRALMIEDYLAGYKAGHAEASRWIDVRERLPQPLQKVLGYRKIMETYSVIFLNSEGKFMFLYDAEYASDITHWLPIVPPQGGERD